MLDAGIVGVSAGLLSWVYLVAPATSGAGMSMTTMAAAAHPLLDLTLVLLAARLLLGAAQKPPAVRIIVGFLILLVVPDTMLGLLTLDGTVEGSEVRWLEVMWCAAVLLLGLAALHPSVTEVDALAPAATPDAGPVRLIVLGVASLLAPATFMPSSRWHSSTSTTSSW
jgi:two-component system cell cycle response regulator